MKIFKRIEAAEDETWYKDGVRELQEVTLDAAAEVVQGLIEDSVICDSLEGKPMRALMATELRGNGCNSLWENLEDGATSSDSISAVSPTSVSECSAGGLWR